MPRAKPYPQDGRYDLCHYLVWASEPTQTCHQWIGDSKGHRPSAPPVAGRLSDFSSQKLVLVPSNTADSGVNCMALKEVHLQCVSRVVKTFQLSSLTILFIVREQHGQYCKLQCYLNQKQLQCFQLSSKLCTYSTGVSETSKLCF